MELAAVRMLRHLRRIVSWLCIKVLLSLLVVLGELSWYVRSTLHWLRYPRVLRWLLHPNRLQYFYWLWRLWHLKRRAFRGHTRLAGQVYYFNIIRGIDSTRKCFCSVGGTY